MIGLAELVLGAWAMIEGAGCSALWVVLLLIALLAYDLLHKKWKGVSSSWEVVVFSYGQGLQPRVE